MKAPDGSGRLCDLVIRGSFASPGQQGQGASGLMEASFQTRPAVCPPLSGDKGMLEGNRPASVALWLRQPG